LRHTGCTDGTFGHDVVHQSFQLSNILTHVEQYLIQYLAFAFKAFALFHSKQGGQALRRLLGQVAL